MDWILLPEAWVALAFSVVVEMLNLRLCREAPESVRLHGPSWVSLWINSAEGVADGPLLSGRSYLHPSEQTPGQVRQSGWRAVLICLRLGTLSAPHRPKTAKPALGGL